MDRLVSIAVALVLVVLVSGHAQRASACGGFFCATPSQPVAQAGEQIAFSIDADGTVTAYVQITWTGPAESFAWIVPVPQVPEVSTGTNALFTGLQAATGVVFATSRSVEGVCRAPHCAGPIYSGEGCGSDSGSVGPPPTGTFTSVDASARDLGSRADGGVRVISSSTVGPYDVVVLEGVDTASINTWLTDNAYLFPPEAVAALDPYVADAFKFVVLRMRKPPPGDEFPTTGELVPLVLRYPNGEPCIPIRLTAIATVPDMPITAYFLADGDVHPSNYLETEVPDELGFWRNPNTYWLALSDEVDLAGGHAFVAEYRGPVPPIPLATVAVDDLAAYTDPLTFFPALLTRGLQTDPKLLDVMLRQLPPPDGVEAATFYNCLGFGCHTYDAYLATVPFDSVAFVADLDRTIVQPVRDAAELLTRYSRLTRLTTTISAEEMNLDPTFRVDPTMRDVHNVRRATLVSLCSATYARGDAPIELRTRGGVRAEWQPGTPYPGDAAWCRARGLMPATPRATERDTCAAGTVPRLGSAASPLVLGLAIAAVVLRRRRRRARSS